MRTWVYQAIGAYIMIRKVFVVKSVKSIKQST